MNSRQLALNVLQRVEDGALINQSFAIEADASMLSARDRHLAQELCFGVTRHRMRYDAFISVLAREQLAQPLLRNILRLGLHQLFALRLADHAAINETVELAKLVGLQSKAGFVNAILRSAQRSGEAQLLQTAVAKAAGVEQLAIAYSHPAWVVTELHETLIRCDSRTDLEDVLKHNNSIAPIQLGVPDKTVVETLRANAKISETALVGCYNLDQSLDPALLNADIWVQDLGSQAVTRAFHAAIPEMPKLVIDACAAPGGKSRMLRALLPPATQLLSLDASTQRLEKLRQVATDSNWSVATADFTQFQGESADAILIDAPCSSLGSVRRKPDTKYRSSRDQLAQHASSQQALIESALHNLKPGGVVGYVTCTPTVAETDRVIRGAIKRGWQTIDAVDAIGAVSPKLVASRRPNAAAMIWGHRNGSDTMFLSLLRKPEA